MVGPPADWLSLLWNMTLCGGKPAQHFGSYSVYRLRMNPVSFGAICTGLKSTGHPWAIYQPQLL